MRPTAIVAHNFMSHEDLYLDLTGLSSAVITGPVGAGKTAILEALTWALYGETRARSLDDLIREGADTTSVSVELEVGGDALLVTRSKARGKDAILAFAVNGQPATAHTSAETKALIVAALGIDYAALLAGPLMTQDDDGALMRVQPRERKELLFRLFGLDRWATWEALAREQLQETRQSLAAEERIINRGEVDQEAVEEAFGSVARLRDSARETTMQIEQAEKAAKAARDNVAKLRARGERAKVAQRELDQERDRFDGLVRDYEKAKDGKEEAAALAGAPEPAAIPPDFEAVMTASSEAADKWARAGGELRALRVIAANKDAVTCPHCGKAFAIGTAVPAEHLLVAAKAADDLEAEARRTATEAGEAVAIKQRWEQWDRAHERALAGLAAADERVETTRSRTAESANRGKLLRAEVEGLAKELTGLVEAEADLDRLDTKVRALRDELRDWETRAVRMEEAAEQLQKLLTEREAALAKKATLEAEAATLAVLAKAFGRDGIPTMMLETLVPRVEDEANAVLERMPGGLHVRLRTQRTTQKGTAADTLDVVTEVAGGSERDYAMLSGGQKFRVDLALRLGLTAVLASRRIDTLVIDEGLDRWQDPEGRSAILDTVTALSDEFALILVVSHNAEVAERFEHRIEVANEAGVSRVTLA